jgi:hypothetical protein
MANIDAFNYVGQLFGKREKRSYKEVKTNDNGTRSARSALQALHIFYEAVEEDIETLGEAQRQGETIDEDLFAKLKIAKEHYERVIYGFTANNHKEQHNLLIAFADSLQDIMICLNRRH